MKMHEKTLRRNLIYSDHFLQQHISEHNKRCSVTALQKSLVSLKLPTFDISITLKTRIKTIGICMKRVERIIALEERPLFGVPRHRGRGGVPGQ